MRSFAVSRTVAASLCLAASLPLPAASAGAQSIDAVAARISAQSLRGHLSFLASDLLEGRGTPSRGQDLAAEYIAAQFRRAGLEPAGDDGYFQTSERQYAERDMTRFSFTVQAGGRAVPIPAGAVDLRLRDALALQDVPVVSMLWAEAMADAARADGKLLVLAMPADRRAAYADLGKFKGKPALLVLVDAGKQSGSGVNGWLVEEDGATPAGGMQRMLTVYGADAAAALGAPGASASVTVPAPGTRTVRLRNVAGVLRGSDPVLKNTYVMLTAHYDHLGIRNGDIYNGANDDGSGTVSVIEIAAALAADSKRPRRSMVFMTFFGEELGLVGSRHYGKHPLFPFKDTVADINLEQIGRTDDNEGTRLRTANLTGFDYSTVPAALQRAGKRFGVTLWKHKENSDRYFAHSDNQSLADAGVPAHTLSVAYAFPDYHGKDDDWQKVDYDNMARIDRTVAAGLLRIANDRTAPKWTDAPNAAKYREAAKKLKVEK
ncbi:M28 family peptidase [Massilia forsythiae]|uniref:M28 family peptidase n=1 Tax=Massilia forsythiae TaxID=2728020 RepID=A0A7Z2VTH3_9BURK|nr:M28 family peptidase [Massilia forsythiae]QJD98910.1 M28 family peptidase [Massilia forsythiae]